jgi:hypothetical protein
MPMSDWVEKPLAPHCNNSTNRIGFIIILPRQIMQTTGERVVVPIMNYILMTLLPLTLVRIHGFHRWLLQRTILDVRC